MLALAGPGGPSLVDQRRRGGGRLEQRRVDADRAMSIADRYAATWARNGQRVALAAMIDELNKLGVVVVDIPAPGEITDAVLAFVVG